MVEQSGEDATIRRNNFDTLRLIAATAVLFSHSFTIADAGSEPLVDFSRDHHTTLGHLAVIVFFSISGYLISASYLNVRNPISFVWRRALRILPALAVVLVASAFVIGPLVSTLPAGAYFQKSQPYTYVAGNLIFVTQYYLPGVFTSVPYPNVVNGSLWTLAPEVACYAAVLGLGVCNLLNRWVLLAISLVATFFLLFPPTGSQNTVLALAGPFAVGAFFYAAKVRLDWRIATLSMLACAASFYFGGFGAVAAWCGTYVVHFLARSPLVRLPKLSFDPSYGVYIWAFPVQQLLEQHFRGPEGLWIVVGLSLPITFALATASYFLIEKPALRLKNGIPPRSTRKLTAETI